MTSDTRIPAEPSGTRPIVVLLLALAQIVTPLLPAIGIGEMVGERSDGVLTLITPAGWAFVIWGPLYAGTIAYAIWQLLPRQRSNALVAAIGWHAGLAFLGNALWVFYTQLQGLAWPSVVIIVFTLVNLLAILRVLARHPGFTRAERLLAVLPLSALAGWLTAATIVNIAAALNFHGVAVPGEAGTVAAIILIVGALIVAAALFGTNGNPWYPLPFLWALYAIHAQGGQEQPIVATAAIAAGAIVLIVLVVMLARQPTRARYFG